MRRCVQDCTAKDCTFVFVLCTLLLWKKSSKIYVIVVHVLNKCCFLWIWHIDFVLLLNDNIVNTVHCTLTCKTWGCTNCTYVYHKFSKSACVTANFHLVKTTQSACMLIDYQCITHAYNDVVATALAIVKVKGVWCRTVKLFNYVSQIKFVIPFFYQ